PAAPPPRGRPRRRPRGGPPPGGRGGGPAARPRFVSRPGNVGPRRPGRNLQARPVSVAEGRGVFSRNGGNAWN
ncbi:hypothetical protein FSB80_16955, partial [Pseudomonas aeruginosa]